jgi:ferredoxin
MPTIQGLPDQSAMRVLFSYSDGRFLVVGEEVPADREEQVSEAARSCPERAIFTS